MANSLVAVTTFARSILAILSNTAAAFYYANKRFDNFQQKVPTNLGASIDYDEPVRFIAADGLVVTTDQPIEQRKRTLTVDTSKHISVDVTAEELIFNLENNTEQFVNAAANEIGSKVEKDISESFTTTYRAYGDGLNPISSFEQYADAMTQFRNYGVAQYDTRLIIPDTSVPGTIGSGLNQFVPNRNDAMAKNWMIGDFNGGTFCRSNLLPIQSAGSVGNLDQTLTLSAINPAGTQLTFTGAGATDTINEGDVITFNTAAPAGSLYFLTFTGHEQSDQPVQCVATADAVEGGGTIVVQVFPALLDIVSNPTDANANLTVDPVGAEAKVLPDHRAGVIMSGNPHFVAMPMLPDQSPFATSQEVDMTTGASLRVTIGALLGQNQNKTIIDGLWGKDLAPDYAMRLVYPVGNPALPSFQSWVPASLAKKAKAPAAAAAK